MPRDPLADPRAEVVDLLTAMGLTKRREGDARRAGAYLRAAREVSRREDFGVLAAEGRLREVPGIGASISRTIEAFLATGEKPDWVGAPGDPEAWWPEVPEDYREAPFPEVPDLHVHTTWSDGTLTVDEVAAYAKRLGARAVGISDHSGSLGIARGLKPDEVRDQWRDVDRVQAAHPEILLLKGTECDILRDGSLDHPPEILAGFDYVLGSLHSQLKLPASEQTERVLKAMEDPHLTTYAHPLTRVPGVRPPANLDLARVFDKAAEKGVALEVNGNRGRLDLPPELAREALAAGARLSLGSDAHSAEEMLGLATARRYAAEAGAALQDLVNVEVLARALAARGNLVAAGGADR